MLQMLGLEFSEAELWVREMILKSESLLLLLPLETSRRGRRVQPVSSWEKVSTEHSNELKNYIYQTQLHVFYF